MSEYPKFSLDKPSRFDLSTFYGRLRNTIVVFDPLKLFLSDAQVEASLQLLKQYRDGTLPPGITDEQLWTAKEVKECLTHPDTGERIPRLLCFAAYTPMQPPILIGMLWPGAGALNQAWWQFYNQSYNALVAYANRNMSSPMSTNEVGIAYAGAVASSIGLSVGMQKLGDRLKASGGWTGTLVRGGAPFVGCVGAGCLSLIMMRSTELTEGVNLKDEFGNVYGKSKIAGREGLAKCCGARFLWNCPILICTPIIMHKYYRSAFHQRNPRMRMVTELAVTMAMLTIGIYPAQAVFTQTAEISASKLEPEFKGVTANGRPVTRFFYNKGL